MANGSDDDDYLSDKFLLNTAEPQKPKTYSEKRKEALYRSRLKNEQNRAKSRRQLELESREEGLSKSLFERAEDDKAAGHGSENKALSMMMKMGFKPGQALGLTAHVDEDEDSTNRPPSTSPPPDPTRDISPPQEGSTTQSERQLVNPLPLNEWSGTLGLPCAHFMNELCPPFLLFFSVLPFITKLLLSITGKKGIGLGKRAPSPTELERLAKAARVAEETEKESFRDRTRREFEHRRAEARLAPAQQTCASLDERAGKEVRRTQTSMSKKQNTQHFFPQIFFFSSMYSGLIRRIPSLFRPVSWTPYRRQSLWRGAEKSRWKNDCASKCKLICLSRLTTMEVSQSTRIQRAHRGSRRQ